MVADHVKDMLDVYSYLLFGEENGVYRMHKSEVARTVGLLEKIVSHITTPDED